MKKRILSLILTFAMILSLAAVSGITVNALKTSGDYTYEVLDDGTVSIRSYNGGAEVVEIPDNINGKEVTIIGQYAFKISKNMTKVVIPDTVDIIDDYAFEGCSALETVILPDGLGTIGYAAFSNCYNLKNINIPNSVGTVLGWAFNYCSNLTNITLPDGVKCIWEYTFSNCIRLESVKLSDELSTIKENAFYCCTALKDINIPSNLQYLSEYAFCHCLSLTDITIPGGLRSIDRYAFEDCPNLSNLTICDGVEKIGRRAFFDCPALKSVTIPKSVTSIANHSFGFTENESTNEIEKLPEFLIYCYAGTQAEQYAIDKGINYTLLDSTVDESDDFTYDLLSDGTAVISGYIGSNATVKIPAAIDGKTVTRIGMRAFENCDFITSVTIPDGVTNIENNAFEHCTSLADISVGENIKYVGVNAFNDTAYYNNVDNWDNGVLYLGNCLLSGCLKKSNSSNETEVLAEVKGNCVIKDGTKSIADSAFVNCKSLETVDIPESVDRIGMIAFAGCSSLKSAAIPSGVTMIEMSAFANCTSLKKVTIPSGVTNVDMKAFYNCTSLAEIALPEGVKRIGEMAFGYYYDDQTKQNVIDSNFRMTVYTGSVGEKYAIDNSIPYMQYNPTVDYGDLNGDGNVNLLDLIAMRKYLAKWSVIVDIEAADCNADGNVNLLDLILMRKYLAKWSVVLGPQG
ncbi:MAG: leucine-rich repeat protein [Acutalibacteraceae bacterium]